MEQKDEIRQSSKTVLQHSLRDRVGVYLLANQETENILASIREAEQAGVQQIWMGDMGWANYADTLTIFAVAATQTEHIRLGTSIVATYPRHPLVMARQALALHDLAPRRLRLGVGPGGRAVIEDWHGLSQTTPHSYLKEYVEVLRSLLWDGATAYQGNFFKGVFPSTRTIQVPLLISALGAKGFQLAGEIADGALSYLCPIPYLQQTALPALRAGAEGKARPAPPIVAHVLVALSTNEAAVLARARQWIQFAAQSFEQYAHFFAQIGWESAMHGDEKQLDALARTIVISGDETSVRSQVRELIASGLDELQLQLLPIASEAKEQRQLIQLIGSLE
ncbi:LLM class F420-dependent oxidoreductase [Reticulibacter mediterranei]|uniref:LLM class F420-dependent oxidoreductase n=1 Tax=Reticulibacter mediterranei TaxID=2778369 RepID=A0A8J3IQA7_9CHLR|nr:LLM class flavin-dependent oxidoreductase [Reticulibacter mediterranei]GHO99989.1 LLM class F420-dependent oxidoreductase [Reticulibacter mediterranei]